MHKNSILIFQMYLLYSINQYSTFIKYSFMVTFWPLLCKMGRTNSDQFCHFGRIIICLKGILRVFCIIFGLLTSMLLSHCTLVSFGANFKGLLVKTITHLYNILISPKSKEPQKVYSIHQCFIVVLSREYVDVVY